MPNHLVGENSPYLIQHSDNPVNWYPWGEEALEKARTEDKPIFLSIGYAACHWCHVMAHESFEDAETAALMNEHFVNIKVDREERPDLDGLYMSAVVSLTGSGGWPMSVFLTADGTPFYGGTYFPPVRRHQMPAFRDVLLGIARLWRDERPRLLQSGIELAEHLRQAQHTKPSKSTPSVNILNDAVFRLAQSYDWKFGGWGNAPKFPQPMVIEFLLHRAADGDTIARDMALHAIDSMALGGMYDVVGGGFARYSTDDYWRVPHFEKMLYDNAQLARVYLIAYMLTSQPRYRQICEETLDFILREMTNRDGQEGMYQGFFSSLDADSEGKEGEFYLWSLDEIRDVLAPEDAKLVIFAYDIMPQGNFDGRSVLQRVKDDEEAAAFAGCSVEELTKRFKNIHLQLLNVRSKRVRPNTDDKILVSWNALTLIALAEAARYLDRPDYLDAARATADFLLTELHPEDRLLRSWRLGTARHNAYLEDYAALILGLFALYQTDPDPYWFSSASGLAKEMMEQFSDPVGGFFDIRSDQEIPIGRPKDLQDNATPTGNALAALALLQLAAYSGEGSQYDQVEKSMALVLDYVVRFPLGFGKWLCAIYQYLTPRFEVAILGDPAHPNINRFLDTIWSSYRFNLVVAISQVPPLSTAPPLVHHRHLVNDLPTVYVCQNFTCQNPTNDPDALPSLLGASP